MVDNTIGSPDAGSVQTQQSQEQSGLEYTLVQDASVGELDAFLGLSDEESAQYVYDSDPVQGQSDRDGTKQSQETGQPVSEEYRQLKLERDALIAERERLLANNSESQKFIGRQSEQIGKLRKELKETNEGLKAGLQSKLVDDPMSAMRDFQQVRENEQKLAALDQHEAVVTRRQQVLDVVSHSIPESVSVDDMALVLTRDGAPAELVEKFKSDPISAMNFDQVSLTLIGKRAEEQKAIVALGTAYRHAVQKNQELEAKLRAIPTSMLQRLNTASRESKGITSGGAHAVSRSSDFNLETASEESLEQLLRQPG